MYSMEKDFSIPLSELNVKDVRVTLLTQVYNAGAKRRMNAENALNDCKKYYPTDYTLLDVFDDLIDKIPRKALPEVQYVYSRFMNKRTADFVTEMSRERIPRREAERTDRTISEKEDLER